MEFVPSDGASSRGDSAIIQALPELSYKLFTKGRLLSLGF
jgi:hypothetical protein